ncbi:MAG: substrate-binding domain-containing protein [Gemmatimonadetes bacterium]|nr:substrate-binding domain-containing protein [Gemmatimonadota bacterium]
MLLSACAGGEPQQEAGADQLTIAVIPKGTTHEFWKSVHAGAMKAAQELSAAGTQVQVIWKGPLREDDREQQVQVVEGFTAQQVDGLVLAPLDDRALVRPVEEAQRSGVPTVIIDSDLQSDALVSFVATDNLKGGELAADRLGELLGGRGSVLMLRYAEGSASTTARETGFMRRMQAGFPNVRVISSDQYAGATRETAKRAAENLLNRHGADIQGIFTPNETSTDGMLLALQDIGKAGQMKFVGFDASTSLVAALRGKQLQGLVVQNPVRMGYLGVKTMVAHLKGETVEKRVDTGVMMVTPDNLEAPEVKELINPPLAQYLGAQ